MGTHKVINIDKIPLTLSLCQPVGYIFTYNKRLPKYLINDEVKFEDVGSTFAGCFDSYFVKPDSEQQSEDIDLILSCEAKNDVVPPTLTENIIIRCDSQKLMTIGGDNPVDNIRGNVMKIVNMYLDEKKSTVEQWAENVIFNCPVNSSGLLPIKYPDVVNKASFGKNKDSISYKNVFIEYDFRAKDYETEGNFISNFENAFEDPDFDVQIPNTYNNILKTIKAKLDEKGYKYKKVDENIIETKLKYLRNIDVEYQLTDFL